MLIALVGASGTGKSTIEWEITKITDYEKIVSWTTRQRRIGEKSGIDYYFKTNEEFQNNLELFAEYEEYSKNRFYGTMKAQYDNSKKQTVVLTPHGVRQLKKKMPDLDVFVVYITAGLKDRVIRYIERCGKTLTYSDMTELSERVSRDFGMFRGFEDEADLVIDNSNGTGCPFDHAISILAEVDKRERN